MMVANLLSRFLREELTYNALVDGFQLQTRHSFEGAQSSRSILCRREERVAWIRRMGEVP